MCYANLAYFGLQYIELRYVVSQIKRLSRT